MLLWEMLEAAPPRPRTSEEQAPAGPARARRLPFDQHCCALTKSGRRCRGKVRKGSEFCVFHDPELAAKRKKAMASPRAKRRRNLSHLPDGYLRKLTDHRSVGQAMDRLYREIRLGMVTPEMGRVLFGVLTRILDSGLADLQRSPKAPSRTKAAKMRPKLESLLTRAEKAAWNRAIANAPGMQAAPAGKKKVHRPAAAASATPDKAIKPQRTPQPVMQPVPVVVPVTT